MFDAFGNDTIAPPINWRPEPSTRGTTNILSTCLITLGLCLWSALHLNIPQHNKESLHKWVKCRWVVIALFAPEVVAYTAWCQRTAARRLNEEMKQLFGEAPEPTFLESAWRFLRTHRYRWRKRFAKRDPESFEETDPRQRHDSYTGKAHIELHELNPPIEDRRSDDVGLSIQGESAHSRDVSTSNHVRDCTCKECDPQSPGIDPEADSFVFNGPGGNGYAVIANFKGGSPRFEVTQSSCQIGGEDADPDWHIDHGPEQSRQPSIEEAGPQLRERVSPRSSYQSGSEELDSPAHGKMRLKARRHPWTMTHSFYALMGGFAFDTSGAEPNFLPNHRTRLCISPAGLSYIAEKAPELIPDISQKEIKDKSKADSLAKSVVCLQAFWFCIQCVTRLAQKKAISLLELNTFAHALCAFLIYALWWHKPLDIAEPTLLHGQKEWEMCALLCSLSIKLDAVCSELNGGLEFGREDSRTLREKIKFRGPYKASYLRRNHDELRIVWAQPPPNTPAPPSLSSAYATVPPISSVETQNPSALVDGSSIMLRPGDLIYGFICIELWPGQATSKQLQVESPRLRRLELASKAIQRFNAKREDFPITNDRRSTVCDAMLSPPFSLFGHALSSTRLLSYFRDEANTNRTIVLYIGFTLAGLLYGGLHLLAWTVPFASEAERILWRFSGSYVIAATLGFSVIYIWRRLGMKLWTMEPWASDRLYWSQVAKKTGGVELTFIPPTLLALGYLLARTFLVVECFLQLARLPPSAYEMPVWSPYFPHIS